MNCNKCQHSIISQVTRNRTLMKKMKKLYERFDESESILLQRTLIEKKKRTTSKPLPSSERQRY